MRILRSTTIYHSSRYISLGCRLRLSPSPAVYHHHFPSGSIPPLQTSHRSNLAQTALSFHLRTFFGRDQAKTPTFPSHKVPPGPVLNPPAIESHTVPPFRPLPQRKHQTNFDGAVDCIFRPPKSVEQSMAYGKRPRHLSYSQPSVSHTVQSRFFFFTFFSRPCFNVFFIAVT